MNPNVWWIVGGAAALGGVYLVYRSQNGQAQPAQQQAASPLMMYAVPPSPTSSVAPDTGGILSVGSSMGATTGGPGADMSGGGLVDSGNGGMDSYYAAQASMAQNQYDLASQQSQYDYLLGQQSIQAQKQMTYAGLGAGFLDQLYPAGYSGSTQFVAGKSPGGGTGFKIDITSAPSAGTNSLGGSGSGGGLAAYFARAAADTPAQGYNYGYQSGSSGQAYANPYATPYTADQWTSMSASQRYTAKQSLSQSQLTNVQASLSPEQAGAVGSQNAAAGLVTGGQVITNQYVRPTSSSGTSTHQ